MPTHRFKVQMTCEGCSNAIDRVLKKKGFEIFEISLPEQSVCVTTDGQAEEVLEIIKKTGKPVEYVDTV